MIRPVKRTAPSLATAIAAVVTGFAWALLVWGAAPTAAQQTTNPPCVYPTATGTYSAPCSLPGSLDATGKYVPNSITNPPVINGNTAIPSYATADVNIANTGAGDIFCIAGSATKTVYVKRIRVSATATSAIVVNVSLIKRSTLDTGGTPVTETLVPLDSTNAAATATATGYTVSPTAGTAVGAVRARKIAIGVQGNTATTSEALFDFANYYDQPLILRGTAQNVCVNVGAAGTGASWAVDAEGTEE